MEARRQSPVMLHVFHLITGFTMVYKGQSGRGRGSLEETVFENMEA